MRNQFHAALQRFQRLFFVFHPISVSWIVILEAKILAVCNSQWFRNFSRLFDQFLYFHGAQSVVRLPTASESLNVLTLWRPYRKPATIPAPQCFIAIVYDGSRSQIRLAGLLLPGLRGNDWRRLACSDGRLVGPWRSVWRHAGLRNRWTHSASRRLRLWRVGQ